ncbi:MAG: hypothetical protein DDG59_00965 [Anaerolineae bacterium]|nr:MAG: hypothetical protein DDG59_00965 [Anaerolineae bacterium]
MKYRFQSDIFFRMGGKMMDPSLPSLGQQRLKSMPLRISLLYFLIAAIYIFFSDRLLAIIIPSLEVYQQAQTYKGWGFVVITTILLYLALSSEHKQLLRIHHRLDIEQQQLKRTVDQLEAAYREMRELAQRCSSIEEVERRRLADELHDRVGQTLTAMNLNLKILERLLPQDSNQAIFERLNEIQALIAEATSQIRDVIAELHPPILDDFGLSEALRWLGERFQKRFEHPITVSCDDLDQKLPSTVEMAFYRVAQSALDNAMRHAQANQVHLTFHQNPKGVILTIEDDGIGFDPEIVLKRREYPTWGVKIMRERMLAVGGQLSIESEQGKGTRVIATWEEQSA